MTALHVSLLLAPGSLRERLASRPEAKILGLAVFDDGIRLHVVHLEEWFPGRVARARMGWEYIERSVIEDGATWVDLVDPERPVGGEVVL